MDNMLMGEGREYYNIPAEFLFSQVLVIGMVAVVVSTFPYLYPREHLAPVIGFFEPLGVFPPPLFRGYVSLVIDFLLSDHKDRDYTLTSILKP
jgi:hypothetical protein